MCSTQTMTVPDGKGGTKTIEDTVDCQSSTCIHSAHYQGEKD
jgi:hypothetical protein